MPSALRSSRLFGALLVTARFLVAQSPSATRDPPVPSAPYTLHAYADLVQVPALVLDQARKSKLGLTASAFFIQIDSGPAFHPRKIHVEGDDPLSIVFLLDAGSARQQEFLERLQEHIADLSPNTFRDQDRISVFAFDCKLIASAQDQPASNALFQHAVTQALASPVLHAQPQGCPHPVFLWDAISGAASLSEQVPGRRVMFVLSPGEDHRSSHSPEVVRRYTASLGMTVIGIRDVDSSIGKPEDLFALLCGGTGGIDLYVTAYTVERRLPYLFNLIRNRYILEFPLPANGTTGLHHLDVTLADRTLMVRSGGNSAPLLDSKMFSDPTLTPDAAPRPILGTRKPIYPK